MTKIERSKVTPDAYIGYAPFARYTIVPKRKRNGRIVYWCAYRAAGEGEAFMMARTLADMSARLSAGY